MWHLGTVTAGCLSQANKVTCFDFDEKVIGKLKNGQLPVAEPCLKDLFDQALKKNNLSFSNSLEDTIPKSDYVYIAFDTPVDKNDEIDLRIIYDTVEKITPLLSKKALLVISSQIPVGTCKKIIKKLRKEGKQNELCYTPENLRLGDAINSFMNPERIVFGLSSTSIKKDIEKLFSQIETEKLFMSLESAEMTKHTMNAYLATLISFSGEISDICEEFEANAIDVMNALKAEKRVSPHAPIMPGLGFGGGTLARDIQILRKIGSQRKIKTEVLNAVYSSNINRMKYIANKLNTLLGTIDKKKIAFLGLVYKAGTNTLRRSLTLQIIDQIKDRDVIISAYDPMIKEKIEGYDIEVCKSPDEAVREADALVIMTDWEEFKSIDYLEITKSMREKIIIDTKDILDTTKFKKSSIQYYGIGHK